MSKCVMPPRRPVLLIIMDGIGVNPSKLNNAVALADTHNLDRIQSNNPTVLLAASGIPVGLPDGQMGNSEVGHLTLGAGKRLRQDLVKINDAIIDKSFKNLPALVNSLNKCKERGKPLHLVGLVSDGGVHSHVFHLQAIIELCIDEQVVPIVHVITDGRDTSPNSALQYLENIREGLEKAQGKVATVCGRFYALDRDKRWDRVEKAWRAIALADGKVAKDAEQAVKQAYESGETDEFIVPTVIEGHAPLEEQDEIFFFNFRNDRPRELSEALAQIEFSAFDRDSAPVLSLSTMTRYESTYPFPYAFSRDVPGKTLGQVVSDAGIIQLRAAETEKYPHVTFFFNGGKDEALLNEDRFLAPSPKVSTYDQQPEMSANEVTNGVMQALEEKQAGLIVVNLANGDMVGHTGVPDAIIKAVETVDSMVGSMWDLAQNQGYSVILTADHGNADMMIDPITQLPHTQHTTFPVPCTIGDIENWELSNSSDLTAIAPTILQLMGLEQPESMTGKSLLLKSI